MRGVAGSLAHMLATLLLILAFVAVIVGLVESRGSRPYLWLALAVLALALIHATGGVTLDA